MLRKEINKMKKVIYEYGCRALGHTDGEIYVEDILSDKEIKKQIEDMAGFSIYVDIEEGFEEKTELVYRKQNV